MCRLLKVHVSGFYAWLKNGLCDQAKRRRRLTGHIKDSDTGLTYMQARYYDPVIGRFLSHDPETFHSQELNVGYFNRYEYTLNNPVNLVDPPGEVTTCFDNNSTCITEVDAANAPSGAKPLAATNANASNMRANDASGTAALDQAASEMASILNQKKSNERVFRMDVHTDENGQVSVI